MSKRPIVIEDLKKVKWVSDPQFSHDSSEVLYVLKGAHPSEKSKYLTQIWSVKEDSQPKLLTGENETNSTPRWSPDDSQIAFNSSRSGSNQIWLLPRDEGEARQLTKFKRPLSLIAWSPDGTKLLASSKCKPEDFEEEKKEKSDVKVITRMHYKMNGAGYHDDRNTHLFLVNIQDGEAKQITDGAYDHGNATFSPDGRFVVFSAKRYEEPDHVNYNDLYSYDLVDQKLKKISEISGQYTNLNFSPDGQWIAFYGHFFEKGPSTLPKLYKISAEGGQAQLLWQDFDFSVGNAVGSDMTAASAMKPVWTEDQKHVLFSATTGGVCHLYKVSAQGGVPEAQTFGERVLYGFSYNAYSNQVVLTFNQPDNMGDLYLYNLSNLNEKRLTAVNDSWYEEVAISLPEQFSYQADNGAEVEGWLLKPYNFDENKKYPMILEIHGGPHVAYGLTFNHEMQVLSSLGYAVLYLNPQGSAGYGQEFNDQTHHDWGGQDYRDVMKGVEVALEKWPFIDPERLGVTGGSYGGYMTNWIIGHSNMFKVAVTQRSTSNRFSMFGTSDVGYNNGNFEFDGKPWINYQHYLERSPIMYVENIETPLMIIHSEQDYRCPIEQGEQLFTALKYLKKEVIFIRFPNENHDLSRSGQPQHRLERLQHIVDWFQKFNPVD
ncbi:MAG: S9 family peptidase [Firmicutes bacterium]|nr:S9 family peptidase [Bacillota bacterium]